MTIAAIVVSLLSCGAAFLALSTFTPLRPGPLNLGAAAVLALLAAFAFIKGVRLKQRLRGGAAEAKTGAALVALLAAVSCGVVCATSAVWHSRLGALRKECAARGWPTSLADLQEDLPDSAYAQPALEKAEANLDLAGPVKEDLQSWSAGLLGSTGGPKAGGAWSRLCPAVDAGVVEEACRGRTRLAKTDYAAAAKDPLNMPFPRMTQHLALARLLRACASRRPAAQAWPQVDRQWRLAELAATHRSLIAQMVTVELETLASKTALDILQRQPQAVLPDRIARVLRARLQENRAADGLRAELAMHFDIPRALRRGGGRVMDWLGVLDLNVLATARVVARYGAVKALGEAQAAQERSDAELEALPSWPYFLARMSMPGFGRLYVREFESRDWARMALLVSAAARFRAARGRYPAALSELVPSFSEESDRGDEVTGKEFSFRAAAGRGFELCSGGLNGDQKDARGAEFCARVRP